MIKETFKSAAEPRYEAPAVAVFEIENEGAICSASTQMFEESDDTLFNW